MQNPSHPMPLPACVASSLARLLTCTLSLAAAGHGVPTVAAFGAAITSMAAASQPADEKSDDKAVGTDGAGAEQPAPLLDENGNPFPPARPTAPAFNAEIASTRFAELAMADALMEIALGELVQRQGELAAARDFGQRMVTNHTAIKLILRKASGDLASALPTALDADQQLVLDRLSKLSGAELDHEYLWEETLRQPRSVSMYRWQYENCDDKNLKQFAVGTLPIIVVHARVADEVHKKINADEIRVQEKRAEAERKAEQARKQAEAQAAVDAAAKKPQRKFKK